MEPDDSDVESYFQHLESDCSSDNYDCDLALAIKGGHPVFELVNSIDGKNQMYMYCKLQVWTLNF